MTKDKQYAFIYALVGKVECVRYKILERLEMEDKNPNPNIEFIDFLCEMQAFTRVLKRDLIEYDKKL